MTRFYNNVVRGRLIRIKIKTQYLRQNFLNMLCIFLIGFLSGNLFGTILNNLRNWVRWDGFIIVGLIATIEAISYFSYKNKLRKSYPFKRLQSNFHLTVHKRTQYLNFFKIGIMVGFFVDAFKVGS